MGNKRNQKACFFGMERLRRGLLRLLLGDIIADDKRVIILGCPINNMSRCFFDEFGIKEPDVNLEVGSAARGETELLYLLCIV